MAKCIAKEIRIQTGIGKTETKKIIKRVSNELADKFVKEDNYHYVPKSVWKEAGRP